MKRILFAILIALSIISCKAQDYIEWVGQSYEPIKYGYLYNWYAAVRPQTVEYGYLYNWYAATDVRNIAASGWHVPTNTNFNTLESYLGDASAGGKLKQTGTTYWNSPNTGATNEVGFNAKGSGARGFDGSFSSIKSTSPWISIYGADNYGYCQCNSSASFLQFNSLLNKTIGYSIRLIKDSTSLSHGQTGTYTGNDGRVYQTICIGTQEWLSENLMETKYRNGDAIPEVTDNTAWAALTTGARCAYNNTITNVGLGNAITSSDDWVVPTDAQNVILQNYIGGFSNGGKLKETGLTYWQTPNTGATNELLFNGRGTGRRDNAGLFTAITQFYNAWSSSSTNATEAKYSYLGYDNTTFGTGSSIYKVNGNPIRLLYTGVGIPTEYVGNDLKKYRVVTIGTQTWLADNLSETKYRDGSTIPVVTDNTAWSNLTTGARCVYNNDEANR